MTLRIMPHVVPANKICVAVLAVEAAGEAQLLQKKLGQEISEVRCTPYRRRVDWQKLTRCHFCARCLVSFRLFCCPLENAVQAMQQWRKVLEEDLQARLPKRLLEVSAAHVAVLQPLDRGYLSACSGD
eukprot:721762-Amphidinium_carterae.2